MWRARPNHLNAAIKAQEVPSAVAVAQEVLAIAVPGDFGDVLGHVLLRLKKGHCHQFFLLGIAMRCGLLQPVESLPWVWLHTFALCGKEAQFKLHIGISAIGQLIETGERQ